MTNLAIHYLFIDFKQLSISHVFLTSVVRIAYLGFARTFTGLARTFFKFYDLFNTNERTFPPFPFPRENMNIYLGLQTIVIRAVFGGTLLDLRDFFRTFE